MMGWCCLIFQDLVGRAGERGLSVAPTVRNGSAVFFLQARAVAPDVTGIDVDFPVTLATQQAIGYCPGCGESLANWYQSCIDEIRMDDLVLF